MSNPLSDALLARHTGSDAPFLEGDDGAILTYDAFLRLTARLGHTLGASGVVPGDRLMVIAPKCAEGLALYAAALQTGAVYLPLNTAYTTAEVAYFVADATPALIVCDTVRSAGLAPLAARHGARILTLDADGTGTLTDAAAGRPDTYAPVDRQGDDLAALLYTSGTTGRSKGAMLTQDNLLSNAGVLTDLWGITDRDRLLHALPIFHTHGLFVAINTALLAGAAVRLMARFDLDTLFDALPRATLMMGVPTFYSRMLADPRLTPAATAAMRLFISGSAPLLAETHRAFTDRTGHAILERYGMTETSMIASNPLDGPRRPGTVGLPLPGCEVRLTADGHGVAPGEIGLIEVRGPNVFKGYRNLPDKTAEDLQSDGFFLTGDLGCLDTAGYLQIVGRQKDLIISGGLNIYPREVEEVLNAVPGVAESAVFGVPHNDFGEAIVAALVPAPGARIDRAAVAAQLAGRLARFKHPGRLVVLDELPRNAMGKVQKNSLREAYSAPKGQ